MIEENFDLIIVTTQILGELFNVLTRKKIVGLEEAKQIFGEITSTFSMYSVS